MARKYNKRNPEYWNNLTRKQDNSSLSPINAAQEYSAEEKQLLKPGFADKEISASLYSPGAQTRRQLWMGEWGDSLLARFPNIETGLLPYQNVHSMVGVADAVELSQKAWANIAIVRNAIEAQVEFSCSDIHLKCKNKKALKACQAWLRRIRIDEFQERFYRELFRSGNVFTYRVFGKLNKSLMDELNTKFGYQINKNEIVVGYIILNPVNVAVKNGGIGLYQSYIKFLTSLELNTLKNSEFGLEMLKQLGIDDETLKNAPYPHVFLEFDSNKIIPTFYQKQDYEPLAIPPLWALMDDLELKLKMKRADESILVTVEDIILLVTHGATKADGGMNPANHQALIEMFSNKLTNRVLVADFTTKAEFVIPDFKMILGKDKYEQVDKDIKEGLGSILIGSPTGGSGEKFSTQMTTVKLFLKKLNGARKKFKSFLEDELERFCDSMSFRDIPTVEQETIDLEDPTQFGRIITQLIQLGVLTPDEGYKTMDTGIFPDKDDSLEAQGEYKKQRDKGLFNPLIGGQQDDDGDGAGGGMNGRPTGTKGIPQTKTKKIPILGNDENSDKISVQDTVSVMRKLNSLYSYTAEKFEEKYGKKIDANNDLSKEIVLNVLYNAEEKDWRKCVQEIVGSQTPIINEEINKNIESMAKELVIDKYLAGLLYHSKEKTTINE